MKLIPIYTLTFKGFAPVLYSAIVEVNAKVTDGTSAIYELYREVVRQVVL